MTEPRKQPRRQSSTRWAWIVATLVALAASGALSCKQEHDVCGDGVATGPEECDLADLRGMTCAELLGLPNECGALGCHGDCTFCVTGCTCYSPCGNGIIEFGESCDCGTDPAQLPPGCLAINGDPASTCDASCHERP
jgi:hypothetical protein